jgi:RNA-directed DNA polymerase
MLIEKICASLGLPPSYVNKLVHAASHSYKKYTVPKRSGGTRTIFHPARPLKAVQRWLAQQVISNWPVHKAAMAYRKGVSIYDNAHLHSQSSYLLRMDFSGFFESIKEDDLRRYIATKPTHFSTWSSTDVDAFCKLCLRLGRLTIGAPTSPALANALCYELDSKLEQHCSSIEITYSRYADDMFFSTKHPNLLSQVEAHVICVVSSLEVPSGLSLNGSKTRHSSKKGARRVTGIVLGSDGKPYVGRDLKRRIRAMIHSYSMLSIEEQATLGGLLSYAVGFDPDFKNSLIAKYGLTAVQVASKCG